MKEMISVIFWYFIISFVAWDLNPLDWGWFARLILVLVSLFYLDKLINKKS